MICKKTAAALLLAVLAACYSGPDSGSSGLEVGVDAEHSQLEETAESEETMSMSIETACYEVGYDQIKDLDVDEDYIHMTYIDQTVSLDAHADRSLIFLPNLTILETLRISCELTQEDIAAIANCRSLRWLTFYALDDLDYSALAQLASLEGLTIWVERPEDLGRIPQIDSLKSLTINASVMIDYELLADMPGLEQIGFRNPTSLSFLSKYPNIQSIGCSYYGDVKLSSGEPVDLLTTLPKLPTLRHLGIGQIPLTDLSGIQNAEHLEELTVFMCELKNLDGIEMLTGLRKIEMMGNLLESLQPLEELEELVYIDLSGNQFSRLDGLQEKQLLEELYIYDNPITDKEHILEVFASLPRLEFYEIDYWFAKAELDEAGISAHGVNKDMYNNPKIEDE